MAIQFPADPGAQTPANTLSPTSTPIANTENDLVYEWNGSVWNTVGGGGGGGGSDMPTGGGTPHEEVFYENSQIVDEDYQLSPGTNALTAGPITVNSSVTVPAGQTWTVVGGAGGGGDQFWERDGTTLKPANVGDGITTDGDAHFTGVSVGYRHNFEIGGYYVRNDDNTLITAAINADGSAAFTGGRVQIPTDSGHGRINLQDSGENLTIQLAGANGSAEFAGNVTSKGIKCRSGINGTHGVNSYNFFWTDAAQLEAWVDATNIGNVSVSSDYRIKREVKPMESGAIPRIKKLNPVSYKLDNFGNLVKRSNRVLEGFIAHEVQEVIPSGATGSKDCENEIQSLRLDSVLAVTVKALQEAVERIEALEARISTLEGGAS